MGETTTGKLPTLSIDPFAMDSLRNPYAMQEVLREAGPVFVLEKYGTYGVARYEEVRAVLKDWESFTSKYGAGLSDIRAPGSWREPGPIVEADPPAHTSIRSVLNKIISPAVIRTWQEIFQREAKALVDRVCDQGEVDGAKDISEAFVMKVFPESLGVQIHRENLVIIGDYNFNALGPQNDLFLKSKAALDAISEWFDLAQTREGITPGGFGEQLYQAEDDGQLEAGIASKLVRTFLRGGMDTTISGISSALMYLAQRPEQWAQLRADRSRLKVVFEEAIRLDSPIQSYYRTTTREVELAGTVLKQDTKIQVFVAAANRDPRKWANPDMFDLARNPGGHVAFGHGIHLCIGQMIARLEGEILLAALLDRVAILELCGEPRYRLLNTLRTLDQLPLRLIPA